MDSPGERARAYYRALDDGDYELLADLLAAGFVQERPDLTLDGRDRFVQFMREERPRTDTMHAVDAVYVDAQSDSAVDTDSGADGDTDTGTGDGFDSGGTDVVVRGRLLTADGDCLVRFVDVFVADADGFQRLDSYTQ